MSYTFLAERGVESWAACFSDIPASVLSRLNLTADKSCSSGSETASSRSSQSGMTSEPLTGDHGAGSLTLCAEASRVRTLAQPAVGLVLRVPVLGYGPSSHEPFAIYDHDSRLLKTRQTLLFEDSTESLTILPEWGTMHAGECFLLAPLVLHTCAADCSFWPTPRASDRDNCGGSNARKCALRAGTYVGRAQNPQLSEWLMGWPTDHTDLKPLAMDRFQQWLRSHGERSQG